MFFYHRVVFCLVLRAGLYEPRGRQFFKPFTSSIMKIFYLVLDVFVWEMISALLCRHSACL